MLCKKGQIVLVPLYGYCVHATSLGTGTNKETNLLVYTAVETKICCVYDRVRLAGQKGYGGVRCPAHPLLLDSRVAQTQQSIDRVTLVTDNIGTQDSIANVCRHTPDAARAERGNTSLGRYSQQTRMRITAKLRGLRFP